MNDYQLMNPYSIPPLMSSVLVFVLGFYSGIRKSRFSLNRIFFAITCAVTVWLASYSISFSCHDPQRALFWSRIGYIGVVCLPVLSLHFHLQFIKKRPTKTLIIPLYSLSVLFAVLSQTNYFLKGPKLFFWGYYPQASTIYPVFILFFIPVLWAGPLLCITEVLKGPDETTLSPVQIEQLKSVIGGFLIASIGVIDFIPKFGIEVYPFAYITIVIWLVIVSSALNQYRLMDIEMAADMVQAAKTAALGLLSAGINHRIRNPLALIKAQAQTFMANVRQGLYQSAEQAMADALVIMEKVEEETNRASALIKKLSQFARSDGGFRKTQFTDLMRTLDDVLELIQYEVELNNVEVKKNIRMPLPLIQADRHEFEEILFHLILNACQEMSLSGGALTISAWQRGEKVQIIIEDTGRGIAKDKLDNIFDPFFTTRNLGKGAGLGLYLTKQLIEKNKGHIRIESEENEGTTAILELPIYGEREGQAACS